MNMWIIVGLVAGLLLVGGVAVVNAGDSSEQVGQIECSTCENSCSAESNCGLATCGAVSGGSCGCGN